MKKILIFTISLLAILMISSPLYAAKKELVFAIGAEAVSLDPPNQSDNPSEMILRHIHDNLVEFTEKMEIVPMLATSWETSADGLTWTFRLRRGVKFHDGTPFDARVVKYNLDRVTNPVKRTQRTSLYEPFIKSVDVVDDYTVRINMKAPFGALLAHLAHGAGGLVSPMAAEKWGDKLGLHPVGTGPYIFEEWIPGDRIVLKRNPDYWKGPAKIEKIVYKPVPEGGSRLMMLETGEADVIYPIPLTDVERLERVKDIKVIKGLSARTIYVSFNLFKAPFNDKRVRQAINYAVDKEAIVKHILRGLGEPSDSMVGKLVWGYSPIRTYPYDPEKAKRLLAEAGYPRGFETTLWTPEGRYPMDAQVAEAVAGQLAKVGIKVTVRKWEWASYLKETGLGAGKIYHDMILLGWAPSTGDADWVLRALFHSDSWMPKGASRVYYSNPEVDKHIDIGKTTADPQKRREAYRKAQEILVEDAAWLMLYDMVQTVGVRENLENTTVWSIEIILVKDAYFR